MANEMQQAASEVRRFVKTLENLAKLGPYLDDLGQAEAVANDAKAATAKAYAELDDIKKQVAEAKLEGQGIVQAAKIEADKVVASAAEKAAAVKAEAEGNMRAWADQQLNAENEMLRQNQDVALDRIGKLQTEKEQQEQNIADLQVEVSELKEKLAALKAAVGAV